MSAGQLGIGIATLGMVGGLFFNAFLPDPPLITVKSVAYADGKVAADFDINAKPAVYLRRSVDIQTPDGASVCSGVVMGNYNAGAQMTSTPLAEWAGNGACQPMLLAPGDYRLSAVWVWQDGQTAYVTQPFEVK